MNVVTCRVSWSLVEFEWRNAGVVFTHYRFIVKKEERKIERILTIYSQICLNVMLATIFIFAPVIHRRIQNENEFTVFPTFSLKKALIVVFWQNHPSSIVFYLLFLLHPLNYWSYSETISQTKQQLFLYVITKNCFIVFFCYPHCCDHTSKHDRANIHLYLHL